MESQSCLESSTNQSRSSISNSEDQSMSSDQSALFTSSDQSKLYSSNIREGNSDSADEDCETYFFESDHVALRGNHDYQMMLRAIASLEAQRIQAVKDLDLLYAAQEQALNDPIQFVEKLQRRVDPKLPKHQKIVSLPKINWDKYTSQLDFSSFGIHRHMTRLKQQLVDGNTEDTVTGSKNMVESDEFVRGRVKTEKKPVTFNQLWTVEEQKRLEDFLIQFPPEEVEARRWQKIASALGNRTPIQVQSRVQKYFIKLAKAGLPIPGRHPNMGLYKKKSMQKHKFQRYHGFYNQPSTFMHSFTPPVYMSDDEDNSQSYEGSMMSNTEAWDDREEMASDDDNLPPEVRDMPEYQELMRLKQLRREKCSRPDSRGMAEHEGFKCDRCNCEPIIGTRWHCTDCPPDVAVDFCDDCVDSPYETETHNSSHRLKPKRSADSAAYMDSDYLGFMPGGNCTSGYNYLDPNYMPAS